MQAQDVLYPEPIIIRYEGLDAERHQVDLALLGQSLQGASRLIGVSTHITLTGQYVRQSRAFSVRVLAGQPVDGCYQVPIYLVGVAPFLPLLSDAGRQFGKRAVEATVNFILSKLGGKESEAIMAMETAQQAIQANRDVTLKAMDLVQSLTKAGEDQLPAARSYAAPIGPSAKTATIGEPKTAFVVDQTVRERLDEKPGETIGPTQAYTVQVSELDVVSGSCKVALELDGPTSRLDCDIADPVVKNPHSPYSEALDSQGWIKVMAKPHIRYGNVVKLTISDTVSE